MLCVCSGSLSVVSPGCRSHSSAPSVSPPAIVHNPVISHWDSPLRESNPTNLEAARKQFQVLQQQTRPMLYSQRPFHAVEVPLFCRGGYPFVKAYWSGRYIDCMVDTGTDTIMWPQWLLLDTQQLHLSRTPQWPRGGITRTEWILSRRIEVGNMVLLNVPTQAIGLARPNASDPSSQSITFPILGMQAFTPFITTIDYRGKKLVLRDTNFDVTRRPRSAHSWLIPYQRDASGRVLLSGTLAGHKTTFLLDTGSPGVYVSSTFAQKYLAFPPSEALHREGEVLALKKASLTINGLTFPSLKVHVFRRTTGHPVALGTPFFQRFRVTIDRFRGTLLLEEYDSH